MSFAYLTPARTDRRRERRPQAVGVGPDNQALALVAE